MKIRSIIILLLYLMSPSILAKESPPIAIKIIGKVTSAQEELIYNTLIYINQFWSDQGKSLSPKKTQKYFSPDTTLIINGKIVYSGLTQFESHFKQVGKVIAGQIKFPLLEIIGVGNTLIVRFDEDVYDNQKNHYPTNVIAIFTIQNGKIQRWEEVVNSTYFCQAGSQKAVWSH